MANCMNTDNRLFNSLKPHDVDIDGTLSRFVDNDDLYTKFLARFPDEDRMQLIYDAFQSNNKEDIIQTVHKLKGVSGNLGMKNISEQCSYILKLVHSDSCSDYTPLLKKLEEDYYRICNTIKENTE